MSKVVVTGLGCATPFGCDVNIFWECLYSSACAVAHTQNVDLDGAYCKVSAQIPYDEVYFPWEKWRKKLPGNQAARFIIFGVEAAERALLDAGLVSVTKTSDVLHVDENLKVGVVAGSGIGGLDEIDRTSRMMLEKGADRVSPFFIPASLINLLSGHISIRHKITGPNQSQVAACSTGAIAIADGARLIREGRCDVVVAGASEASVGRIGIAGFCALQALAKGFNDNPSQASRPFDTKRAGFVMGEGAGMLILESEEHAKKRGAKIYCEFVSDGLSSDAYHITKPCSDGAGAARAMKEALARASLKPSDIGYINAHATSTGLGDASEMVAIKSVFGDCWSDISVSSTKGAIGHMLGAAGAIEAIASILCLQHQAVLPTLNLVEVDESAYHNGVLLDLVRQGKKKELKYCMSNSFGFGGTNATLVFGLY